jgi:hypothetical protein
MRKVKMMDVEEHTNTIDNSGFEKTIKSNFFEISGLPSKGLLYPAGTKISGRPFTVKEVKRLATMNENNYNAIIKEILLSCVDGIDINQLLVSDKIYIIFWLRANTYKDANFTTPYICDHCGRESDYFFDVGNFDFTYLPDDFKESDLVLTLLNGQTLELKYLSVSDEDKINNFKLQMRNGLSQYDEVDIAVASMIRSINGKQVSLKAGCEYLDSIDPMSWAQLNSFIEKIDFGVTPEIKATCKFHDCGEVSPVKVNFRPEFFIPRYNA